MSPENPKLLAYLTLASSTITPDQNTALFLSGSSLMLSPVVSALSACLVSLLRSRLSLCVENLIDVAKSLVEKYRPRLRKAPSPTWKTFLKTHVKDVAAFDFFTVP